MVKPERIKKYEWKLWKFRIFKIFAFKVKIDHNKSGLVSNAIFRLSKQRTKRAALLVIL